MKRRSFIIYREGTTIEEPSEQEFPNARSNRQIHTMQLDDQQVFYKKKNRM
jgi:hypothetical protein